MLNQEIDSISFDVFTFKKLAKGDELTILATYLFQRHNFFEYLNINQITFTNLMKKIQSGYRPNPYHNDIHAADVLQVIFENSSFYLVLLLDCQLYDNHRRIYGKSRFKQY